MTYDGIVLSEEAFDPYSPSVASEVREPHKGYYSRGYLPHIDAPRLQFVTFRLHDSFPTFLIDRWRKELDLLDPNERRRETYRRTESYVDAGHGACWLREPEVARIVEDQFRFHDGERYSLRAWTIMPNHVHLLIDLLEGHLLPRVVQSWKARSARAANEALGRRGPFWYRDYFDRYIRDEVHLSNVIAYIDDNPVKAGLCPEPSAWAWGSARLMGGKRKGAECYSAVLGVDAMILVLDSTVDDVFDVLRRRSVLRDDETERIVKATIDDVRQRGDVALLDNARRFDAPGLESVLVTEQEIEIATVDESTETALRTAERRVRDFHEVQWASVCVGWDSAKGPGPSGVTVSWNMDWDMDALEGRDVFLGQRLVPVKEAGVYVPGGNAVYPSSVIMNAVPAKVGGVERVTVTTPAGHDGTLHPAVLVALRLVGVTQAFKIGGAAAIAALALGTESVPRVDKIVGPGNRFVNEAKRQLWGQVGLDGYAGPSEVCVLADDRANEEFAAADLLTQVEHARDNAGFLVCVSREKLDRILAAAERQLSGAPREATMRQALAGASLAIVARDLDEALEIVNAIAPEHLTLAVAEPERAMERVRNAGCILLGEWTPESAGDYCLGPSHTLPTGGAARWQSPVNVLDFLKVQSVARLTPGALRSLIPTIETLANVEGFPAHAYGATVRRDVSA